MILRLFATLLAFLAIAAPAHAQLVGAPHVRFELAPQNASAQPGSTINVAVHQTIEKGWHTYWKNSGDAGQATQIKWDLPSGWSAGDIVWPAPKRLREATLMTYGYEDQVWLTVPIKVPASARPGTVPLAAHVDVLVCKDICVPESADVKIDLTVATGAPLPDPRFGLAVSQALAAAPKVAPIQASVALQGSSLKLWAVGGPLKGADATGAYFYPAASGVIDHPARQAVEHGPDGLALTLKPAPALGKAGLAGPVSGLLETRRGVYEITAQPGGPLSGATGLGTAAAADETPAARPSADLGGLAVAVLFALIGGVILNLMPCVFPVLSMKAAALARQAHDPAEARRDGFAFAAGALTTFLTLALILMVSKAAGHAVGWGFQLQSPDVTAFLTLLVLAIALNLSGVFEAGLSLQGVGSELQTKPGVLGPFFTGVLAVVVGAPCTAPFMASALGYALTAGPLEILLVFLALGLGLALPFVALSLSPGLLRRFPKPGPWMETLRHILAFPMYATAAFMAWVFAQQAGDLALGWLMAATVGLGLCAYLLGRAQREHAQGRQALVSLGVAAVSLMLVGFLAISATIAAAPPTDKAASAADLASEPFTPERLAAARAEGRPVFVNFTAAWCVTCKVNERLAFSDPAVAKAFADTRTLYLVGDWTRRDDTIAKALAEQGRTGVPLYLVYNPGSDKPKVLPQVLTGGMIAKAVKG